MIYLHLLSAILLASRLGLPVQAQNTLGNITKTTSGFPPCDALISSGLGDRVVLATSEQYESRVKSYWSANARLRPWCFVLPRSTDEVSRVTQTLAASGSGAGDWHIAIRSGGHHLPGFSNIANGVTIDLGMMNSSVYDPKTNLASVEPGARWGDVYYNLLRTANVTAMGGRDAGVGVGGFLLGGGISFHTGRNGFACNAVVNMEIVLADGSVINANEDEHPELFKALKGGSSNFGIVTRFDVQAIPAVDIGFGVQSISGNYSDEVQNAFVKFTDGQEKNKDDALITIYSHADAESADTTVVVLRVNTLGNMNTTSFDEFNKIPALSKTWDRVALADALNTSATTYDTKNAWTTITIPNNPEILNQSKIMFDALISSLNDKLGAGNFALRVVIQPLPAYVTKLASDSNVLGADRMVGNSIIWNALVSITGGDDEDAALAVAKGEVNAMTIKLERLASATGGGGWVYLNYADSSQDPLGSYGRENVAFLKKVAADYDPEGWWQKRVPGGFKLSRVDV